MVRSLKIAFFLASSIMVSAQADAGGPSIAYVKAGGTAQEIFLVNPDGTGTVRLYAAPRKTGIASLDLRPGGNEIAFVESASGKPRVAKILKFSDSGANVGLPVTVPNLCAPDYVDYNPVNPTPPQAPLLIVSEVCNGIKSIISIRTDGTDRQVLQQGPSANFYVGQPRWLNDGSSYVYVRALDSNPTQQQLCRDSCDAALGQLLWAGQQVLWLDVARTSNTAIFMTGADIMKLVNADTATDVTPSPFIKGRNGHLSPADTYVLYESPHLASGDFMQIYNMATGQAPRLTGKGEYGPADWRN